MKNVRTMEKIEYTPPEVEVIEVQVERGFASSDPMDGDMDDLTRRIYPEE